HPARAYVDGAGLLPHLGLFLGGGCVMAGRESRAGTALVRVLTRVKFPATLKNSALFFRRPNPHLWGCKRNFRHGIDWSRRTAGYGVAQDGKHQRSQRL